MDGDFNCQIWNTDRGLLNQRVCKLSPDARFIDKHFLAYGLPAYLKLINNNTHSITVKHLSSRTILDIPFPLPSMEEQRRVVAKLDSLFTRSRAAREQLAHIPTLVEYYKRAILEKAFSGGLTADWRAKQNLPIPKIVDVGSLVSDIRYGTAQKCFAERVGVPVVRIPNVSAGRIDLTDLKYAELSEKQRSKLALSKGDILIVRSNGSVDLVGRPTIVTAAEAGLCYAGYLIRLRPDHNSVAPEFLKFMLESPQIRKVIETSARSTSGVHNVNGEELGSLRVPCPTLAEQHEVVHLIKTSMTWLESVSSDRGKAAALLDQLEQSLLAKAFRGELVLQNPKDEPAHELLERLRVPVCVTRSKNGLGRKARSGA